MREINSCEVCNNKVLVPVLDLGLNPMCDDLVPVGDTRVCQEYPIEILFCKNCCTAYQRFQVPKQDLFPTSYHYRSRFTADVLTGMKQLAESCIKQFGSLAGKKVLDIGCNDGSLLDVFKQHGAITMGIEPTGAYVDAEKKGHVTFNKFLSEDVADTISKLHGKPDFITFTNVFAHIEDLSEVIRSLKRLMSPKTVIVIENHYLGAVLNGNQFDTFYHEHPRTYSFASFAHIARGLETELVNVEFPSRYGGNIRVFLGKFPQREGLNNITKELGEESFLEKFTLLRNNLLNWRKSKREFLDDQVRKHGPLRAKAFPGRAGILIKLLDLDENMISAVYEKAGSLKVDHYLPGTRIPIRSDNDLFAMADKSQPIINFAWHIPTEIKSYLTENGYAGPVFDILSREDFAPKR